MPRRSPGGRPRRRAFADRTGRTAGYTRPARNRPPSAPGPAPRPPRPQPSPNRARRAAPRRPAPSETPRSPTSPSAPPPLLLHPGDVRAQGGQFFFELLIPPVQVIDAEDLGDPGPGQPGQHEGGEKK